ncbi:hypothetical protein JR316_0007595 [Psilocybe cubensis]|uniref:Uncharacterized protein n=1 Tax=Psilocybe cubensis TaxID=181762 RepID=A0ACB8GUX2_PSICU|nr:hypothetical protein JR316_0007595 [Psilocybe cubensis]KAH9479021.1 hypothetical protein JR316_0007595 [Psilocybe cubensis]
MHSALGVVDPGASAVGVPPPPRKGRTPQRICLLAMCGIHLGLLRYLSSSTLVGPYLQYFESMAARELFEFQARLCSLVICVDEPDNDDEWVNKTRRARCRRRISSDFLCALLILLLHIRNAGLPDSGPLAHLSEATAGSLSGIGHSTAYEEEAYYRLAMDYVFLADDGRSVQVVLTCASSTIRAVDGYGNPDTNPDPDLPPYTYTHPPLTVDPFNAAQEQNDYEIPWALRDVITDERIG